MKIQYRFPLLSRQERETNEQILDDECEKQSWYIVMLSVLLADEIIICVQ